MGKKNIGKDFMWYKEFVHRFSVELRIGAQISCGTKDLGKDFMWEKESAQRLFVHGTKIFVCMALRFFVYGTKNLDKDFSVGFRI